MRARARRPASSANGDLFHRTSLMDVDQMKARPRRPWSSAVGDLFHVTSLLDVDRSGRVKMETLEIIYRVQSLKKWCSVYDVFWELEYMGASPVESGRRGVSMRLLRYKRQGLLIRMKIRGKSTKYKLSQKGEDRLTYFWEKFELLDPPPGWESMGEEGRLRKELADERFLISDKILSNQIKRLENDKSLRTPKVRQVINFESVLKEIEERANRMRCYPRRN